MKKSLFGREKCVFNLLSVFGKFGKILDIGCYDGLTTESFAQHGKKMYGIEPDENALLSAQKRFNNTTFKVGVAENIPFNSNLFDCVIFSDVLEHVDDEQASINEIYRVLKPGGILILTTPHKGLFHFLDPLNYRWHLNRLLGRTSTKPFHRHYTFLEIAKMLVFAGFDVKKIIYRKRFGMIISPVLYNLELVSLALGIKSIAAVFKDLKKTIGEKEWQKSYGKHGYYIALVIKK